jgi:chromosomal replication initiator protein
VNSHWKENDPQLELGEDEGLVALRKAWERTLWALGSRVSKSAFESFFRATRPLSFDGETAVLGAPSGFAREWLEKRYGQTLKTLLAENLEVANLQIRFVLTSPQAKPILGEQPPENPDCSPPAKSGQSKKSKASNPPPPPPRPPLPPELTMPLAEKLNFESFVVGKSNRLAQAGAQAVADAPGKIYNPLFLYGGPGLGKTHLMQAIGHAIQARHPEARVAYISGESFTNGYIAAIRERKFDYFRSVYRNVDVWLVDDVQFLAATTKSHTKEEFFHTFNTLHQMDKQIVLASDRSPRELRMMDERLISRFECGLIADIAPPELEMRVAILQKKAEAEGLDIPYDVLFYMANLIQSNIRSLEGALIKLMAYASIAKSPVNKQLASDVLGSYFVERRPVRPRRLSEDGEDLPADADSSPLRSLPLPPVIAAINRRDRSEDELFDHIIETVADHFGIDPHLIAGEGSAITARRRNVAAARQIAIYLAREKTDLAVTDLAHRFGGMGHSAISHAHKKMVRQVETEPKTIALLREIASKLRLGD